MLKIAIVRLPRMRQFDVYLVPFLIGASFKRSVYPENKGNARDNLRWELEIGPFRFTYRSWG